jgi:hypothetical protein
MVLRIFDQHITKMESKLGVASFDWSTKLRYVASGTLSIKSYSSNFNVARFLKFIRGSTVHISWEEKQYMHLRV